MTGAAAAVIFPVVKTLDPTLPEYAAYTGPHWRLAAGHVASRIFLISDAVQLGCIIITGLTLGVIALSAEAWAKPIVTGLRIISLLAAISLMTYSFAFLGPRMNTNMVNYWDAAKTGDNESALAHQQAFDKDHPTASRVMVGSFLCALLLNTSGAFAASGASNRNPLTGTSAKRTLEEPSLSKDKQLR
ncbi:MAG: hypothetical protein ED559_09130 [Phycisphaera sp.]|nr:MAG: hypothetical protein ED559_09130 [Phycisphaera sp.]